VNKKKNDAQPDKRRDDCSYCRCRTLGGDEKSALVDDVGKRASRKREQKNRQAGRHLDQRYDQWLGVKA